MNTGSIRVYTFLWAPAHTWTVWLPNSWLNQAQFLSLDKTNLLVNFAPIPCGTRLKGSWATQRPLTWFTG